MFTTQIFELFRLAYTYIYSIYFCATAKIAPIPSKMLFSSLCSFQYVVVCVILILGQTAAVVIFYKFPQVVSNKEILFS